MPGPEQSATAPHDRRAAPRGDRAAVGDRAPAVDTSGGRPPGAAHAHAHAHTLAHHAHHAHTLALDVGGTGIKAGLVTGDGRLTRTWRRATRIERGPQAVIDTIADFAAELVQEAAAEGTPVAAAGFALPGLINEQAGVGVFSATVGWRGVPFRDLLGARLAVPIAIGHDVRAGGVAEARLGAGRGSARFVFLPLGTSIGGAIMIDGVPDLGPHGMGGEFGHIVVRPGGLPCGCGLRGCLAQYSSAGAVAARYAAAAGTSDTGALDVAARLATGDPIARELWDEAVDVLADALLTTSALLDPDRVVIGGGLAEAGEALMKPLAEALAAKAAYHVLPELVTAELGDLAGCLGAGLLAWDLVPGVPAHGDAVHRDAAHGAGDASHEDAAGDAAP